MNRDYGTNLLKYIFEPNDQLTATDVEEEIRNTVALYIPEVKITSVNFNWNETKEGQPIPETQLNVSVQVYIYRGFVNRTREY